MPSIFLLLHSCTLVFIFLRSWQYSYWLHTLCRYNSGVTEKSENPFSSAVSVKRASLFSALSHRVKKSQGDVFTGVNRPMTCSLSECSASPGQTLLTFAALRKMSNMYNSVEINSNQFPSQTASFCLFMTLHNPPDNSDYILTPFKLRTYPSLILMLVLKRRLSASHLNA